AGLSWAVKLDKGDFIGRDSLQRRREDKALPRRVGLELEGKRPAREGTKVLRDGREIGHATSGTLTPTVNKAIATAYVDPPSVALNTLCEVDIRGKRASARVVAMPFYKRTK